MKIIVPFYSNTLDNVHCFQAVIRMVLKYFLPEKEFSWEEIEKMTNFNKDLWTWSMAGVISLRNMGFEIVNMEDFDYDKFALNGEKYLYECVRPSVAKEQIMHSDISSEISYAKQFVRLFGKQHTIPTEKDIRGYIDKGYLVICNINGKILQKEKGYEGHFVLIFSYDKNNFYLHDPGLPPRESIKIPYSLFKKAWAYPTKRERNLVALKYSLKQP